MVQLFTTHSGNIVGPNEENRSHRSLATIAAIFQRRHDVELNKR